jgi:predicted YcjX-like family ATPase
LTSLIYRLHETGSRGLAAFDSRSIELLPANFAATGFGKFPYETYVADLRREPPKWPEPTDTEYQAMLVIPFRDNRARGSLRLLPRRLRKRWIIIAALTCVLVLGLLYCVHLASATLLLVTVGALVIVLILTIAQHRLQRARCGTIELNIYDYPGEFLLDVELAKMSFEEWSIKTIERMREQCPEEADQYDRVVREVGALPGPGDLDAVLSKLRAAYADYVAAAHANHFEMMQPGMALLTWTRGLPSNRGSGDPGRNILPFIPLPAPVPENAGVVGPLRQSLREAYGRYVEINVARFVRNLGESSTQVVLVDVLRVLANGLKSYNDTRKCLASTLTAYRYNRRWLGRRIRRVVFAATKADHALKGDRPHLATLLQSLGEKARGRIGGALAPRYRWLASLRATTDAVDRRNDRPEEVLKGTKVGEKEEVVWNPGPVPNEWPDRMIPLTNEPWVADNDFYSFPRFAPPEFPARDGAPLPDLNLDELLWDILEPCFSYQAKGVKDGTN